MLVGSIRIKRLKTLVAGAGALNQECSGFYAAALLPHVDCSTSDTWHLLPSYNQRDNSVRRWHIVTQHAAARLEADCESHPQRILLFYIALRSGHLFQPCDYSVEK